MIKETMHYCFNCGEELGMYPGKQIARDYDTCGKKECNTEAHYSAIKEREDAHEELDRINGW